MASTEPICAYCAVNYPPSFCILEKDGGCFAKDEPNELGYIMSPTEKLIAFAETEEKVYKDAVSTGRKRAAQLYPIAVGQICEWAWKKNCGGGPVRITGCTGRPAAQVHHGVNKSTLRNERENISVICDYCHSRFHVANDKFYVEPRPANGADWLPTLQPDDMPVGRLDEMQDATKQEILLAELAIPEGGKDVKRKASQH
jgi:hypothetical protein